MSPLDNAALALVIAILATIPLFAVRSRGRPMDAEVAQRPASVLLGFWLRNWLMWVIAPLERLCIRARLSPDILNVLGLAFGMAAGLAFVARELSLAGWFIVAGGICDVLDGRVARRLGVASAYGAFLDSTLDRFAETFTFLGLAWYFASNPWAVLATFFALGGSLLVSYARARGEALGVTCKDGLMQRAERLVLLALASLFDSSAAARFDAFQPGTLVAWTVAVIGLGAFGTAAYRTVNIVRTLKKTGNPRT
jgi:phosphatidylinositol phosphate synthase